MTKRKPLLLRHSDFVIRPFLLLWASVSVWCASASFAASGLDGCLYWIDGPASKWTAAEWKMQVGHMQRAGFRHVIVTGPAYSLLKADAPADAVLAASDRLMEACRGTSIQVYHSVWANYLWYASWNLREELDTNRQVIDRIAARYAQHPNFAGWYIPHEIYVVWDKPAEYIRDLYAGLSAMCKQRTPGKLVVLSPFFILDREGWLGNFRFVEPGEYETFWYELLKQTQIDIVALQDSGEHLSCTTMQQRRPYLAAMSRACSRAGKSYWINIETGELHVDSLQDYAKRFGRKTHVNDAKTQPFWRGVPADKLQAKMALAHEFTPTTITWGYQQYWDPMRGEPAHELFASYLHAARPSISTQTAPPQNNASPSTEFVNSLGMRMILISAGECVIGSPLSWEEEQTRYHESGRGEALPQSAVRITRPFYLCATEVTVGQFRRFVESTKYVTDAERGVQIGEWKKGGFAFSDSRGYFEWKEDATWKNPGFEQEEDHPVVVVSYNDAKAFCDWLSGRDGREYRPPNETQWECACRAGTQTEFWWGDGLSQAGQAANIRDAAHWTRSSWVTPTDDGYRTTAPVGHYRPNAFGLYDMIGNVMEWCSDWEGSEQSGLRRVFRGGSWRCSPADFRAAKRGKGEPSWRSAELGFRVSAISQ